MANKLSAWIRIQELYKHPTVLFPFLLGTAIAWSEAGIIDWRVFAVSIIATYFITNVTFMSNEYFDYETDRMNIERVGGDRAGVTTTGGTRVLAEGLLPRKQVLIASILFFIAAIPLGILFMAIGFTIPVFMGYYLQQGFNWLPLIVALPWTLDVPALKIIREFPDYEADLSTNRGNLVVIFGKERMASVYILLTICSLILFVPVIFIIKGMAVLLLLLPAFFLLRSLIPMIKGEWKNKEGLDAICKNGFIGMLFILVALTGIFILKGLLSVF